MITKKSTSGYTTALYANYFDKCGIRSFEDISDEKLESLKKKAIEINKKVKKEDDPNYYVTLLDYIRDNITDLNETEKVLLLVLIIDPDCITWKLYNSTKIPDISEMKKAYTQAKTIKEKSETKLKYEDAIRKRTRSIIALSNKIQDEVGIFLQPIIPIEKLYLNRKNYLTLKKCTNKDNLTILNQVLKKLDLIKEITEERKEALNKSLKHYQETFSKVDINLLIYHVFVQAETLGIRTASEQLYFLINAAQLGYEEDETLAAIYQYYCTWDAMNEELKRVYGYSSIPLLRLQGYYNTIYNVKGDF